MAEKKVQVLSLDEVWAVVQRLHWPWSREALESNYALGESWKEAWDSVLTIAEIKRRVPLRQFCEEALGMKFQGGKAKCPLHDGQTHTSFVLSEDGQRWSCFGDGCEPPPGKEVLSGDVIELVQRLYDLKFNEAMDLLTRYAQNHRCSLPREDPNPFFRETARKQGEGGPGLTARALAQIKRVDLPARSPVKAPRAGDFANLLLELVGGGLPMVFFKVTAPIIGGRAKLLLRKAPETLAYLGTCTALSTQDGHKNRNSEGPTLPLRGIRPHSADEQLRLIWTWRR